MKCARMLMFIVVAGCLYGCGGGGGGSSSSSRLSGSYSGTYTASDSTAGTCTAEIASGGRTTMTIVENGSNRNGIMVGRILDNEITGSLQIIGGPETGFNGTVQQHGGSLTLNVTYLRNGATATYNLGRG